MKNLSPIIPVSTLDCQVKSDPDQWKAILKSALSDPAALLDAVGLAETDLAYPVDHNARFSVRVPQPFIKKIKMGDPQDPLLRQVLSVEQENHEIDGFISDPLREQSDPNPGLLHKYHGRVLLMLTSACAVNCRYCFRRHFPYQDKLARGDELNRAIETIAGDSSISEVILSGGDPLVVNDENLQSLLMRLAAIPHLRRLRVHSRLPVVIPQRITPQLCQLLAHSRLEVSLVLHINHPNEIDSVLVDACQALRQAGVILLNQSVLLHQVNDDADCLAALSEKLFSAGILPYYLHLLDKVAGAAHFDLPQEIALELIQKLRNRLPGYLVPRLAREVAGEKAKQVLAG